VLIASLPGDKAIKVKLGDFGLGEHHTDPDKLADSPVLTRRGTPDYFAPEMFPRFNVSCNEETIFRQELKADIWAAGILAAFLFTGEEGFFFINTGWDS
jgi:serine/threonine protein kinase